MDGTPRKKTDCSLLNGLMSFDEISFEHGLSLTYKDFLILKTVK